MTAIAPSVWTWSIDQIQDHLAYLNQQGLVSLATSAYKQAMFDFKGELPLHFVTISYARVAFQDALHRVDHHLSWAIVVRKSILDDGGQYNPTTLAEPNLVQARAAMVEVLALADELRNLLWFARN